MLATPVGTAVSLPGQRHNFSRVQDQPDTTVAEDRSTRNTADLPYPLPESLCYYLLLTEQFIDNKSASPSAVGNDGQKSIRRAFRGTLNVEQSVQPQNL